MRLIVLDDHILGTAADDGEITASAECEIYRVPDGVALYAPEGDSRTPRPLRFSELGITRADSDRYEVLAMLRRSDTDMCRVVEDLIDLLIVKSGWEITDLPTPVQEKIAARKTLRENL